MGKSGEATHPGSAKKVGASLEGETQELETISPNDKQSKLRGSGHSGTTDMESNKKSETGQNRKKLLLEGVTSL